MNAQKRLYGFHPMFCKGFRIDVLVCQDELLAPSMPKSDDYRLIVSYRVVGISKYDEAVLKCN